MTTKPPADPKTIVSQLRQEPGATVDPLRETYAENLTPAAATERSLQRGRTALLCIDMQYLDAAPNEGDALVYTVTVNGQSYVVEVAAGGDISTIANAPAATAVPAAAISGSESVKAPLAGNIVKVHAAVGDAVAAGDVIVILEAMKMETEVRAPHAGTVAAVSVKEGDSVAVGDTLLSLA